MPEVFKCPSCSAPLEFEGKTMQKCKFCQSNVIVPSDLVKNSNDFGNLPALKRKALQIAEIQKLIQSGQKIYAIKLFRETFAVGLKEAKDAVDAMEEGKSIDVSGMQIQTTNFHSNAPNVKTHNKNGNSYLVIFIVLGVLILVIVSVILYGAILYSYSRN